MHSNALKKPTFKNNCSVNGQGKAIKHFRVMETKRGSNET